jgi:predicted RNA methylase
MDTAASKRQQLQSVADMLLNDEPQYLLLHTVLNDWYQQLCNLTGINNSSMDMNNPVHLPSGKAIATDQAAHCITDIVRTRAFVRGICAAVCKQQQQFPGRPTEILYAGTGPFATLVLPLFARFAPEAIQFTLIEVNPQSMAMLQQVIEAYHATAYIRQYICADAAEYEVAAGVPPDVFICETLQRSLRDEPQVMLMMHFCPQLPAHCMVIPEQIEVSLALRKTTQPWYSSEHIVAGTALLLNREQAVMLHEAYKRDGDLRSATEKKILLQQDGNPLWYWLTTLKVYDAEWLRLKESILTLPEKINTPLHGDCCALWYEVRGRKMLKIEPC